MHRFDNNSSSRLYFCQRQTYSFEVEKLITEMCWNQMKWNEKKILWIQFLISLKSLDGLPSCIIHRQKNLSICWWNEKKLLSFKVGSIAITFQIHPQRCEKSIKIYYLSSRLTPRHSQRNHSRKSPATPSAWMEMENCFFLVPFELLLRRKPTVIK